MRTNNAIEIMIADWPKHEPALMQIRRDVFITEQGVTEQDEIDNLDSSATHLLAYIDSKPIGTLRLLPNGKITRMAVLKPFRNKGVGKALVQHCIKIGADLDQTHLTADAQTSALSFYEKLGFEIDNQVFMDAGIPHQRITYPLNKKNETGVERFESAKKAQDHILTAAKEARLSLHIFTHKLDPKLFDTPALQTVISSLARKGRQTSIKILARDTKPLHKRKHSLVSLCQRLPSSIQIRHLTEDWSDPISGFVIADKSCLVFFNDEPENLGFYNAKARAESRNLIDQFEYAWQRYAIEDVNLRQFTL